MAGATLALCAPRLTFISRGFPERGDAHWLDHQNSFIAAISAQPVYGLLEARNLGRSDDYTTEKIPGVDVGVLDGALAWRQQDGGHTDRPNVGYFIHWAAARWRDAKKPDDPAKSAADSDRYSLAEGGHGRSRFVYLERRPRAISLRIP
jgi:hypothetical protein